MKRMARVATLGRGSRCWYFGRSDSGLSFFTRLSNAICGNSVENNLECSKVGGCCSNADRRRRLFPYGRRMFSIPQRVTSVSYIQEEEQSVPCL